MRFLLVHGEMMIGSISPLASFVRNVCSVLCGTGQFRCRANSSYGSQNKLLDISL
jgi:hypothetical protein